MSKSCYHCGLDCDKGAILFDEKEFCCNGCKSVYEILNKDALANFYELNHSPGIKPISLQAHEYDFLEDEDIKSRLLLYQDDEVEVVKFKIPVIHCTSCVWVLESLHQINEAIQSSKVQFVHKTVQIQYKPKEIHLREVAELLANLGYKPVISLDENTTTEEESFDRNLITKLGVAGFCFGNVMLFAFPEYFTNYSDAWFEKYKILFRYLMLFLSLPVVFYCASSYFKSAYTGIKNKIINIDIPISLGILVLFLRSVYEVSMDISSGYFDSLCGLVFFMLIGRYFQQNTYKSLSFDRDYRSFYPLSISKIDKQGTKSVLLSDLEVGDRIWVRNREMIPADSVLIKGEAEIDNSFITGESHLVRKKIGEKIYAGGMQVGSGIELELIKKVDESYLTSLWQNAGDQNKHSYFSTLIEKVSQYFTIIVIAIAILGGVYWFFNDASQMWQVITAVLIVACPCALALSTPFTLGNIMRFLGLKQVYTKDITTIEKMSDIDSIVLDKTGTLTETQNSEAMYFGKELSKEASSMIGAVLHSSNHPLSRGLVDFFDVEEELSTIVDYEEVKGKGVLAKMNDATVKIGSAEFIGHKAINATAVYISINEEYLGRFEFKTKYRRGIENIIKQMPNYTFRILSGDNAGEQQNLETLLGKSIPMSFNQSPEDKFQKIKELENAGEKVMMIGDGLNDAAALLESQIGMAVAEDVNNFTPSSDVIIHANQLYLLPQIMALSKKGTQLVKVSMLISFLYNIVGLSFALSGMLSPIVAAILMPVSSLSVVIFASVSTWYYGNAYFNSKKEL